MKILIAILLLIPLTCSMAGAKSLTWDANAESDLAGYRVYYRDVGGGPSWAMTDVGNIIIVPLADLGITADGHEFFVTAYDVSGNESGASNIVDDVAPSPPGGCRLVP